MSLEQALVLIALVVIPLIQAFARRRAGHSDEAQVEPDAPSPLEELLFRRDQAPAGPEPPQLDPPATVLPPAPLEPPFTAGLPARLEPQGPRRDAMPSASISERGLPAPGAAPAAAQRRRLREMVPRDPRGLRRAIVLADVLGPPRSLDGNHQSSGAPRRLARRGSLALDRR